MMKMKTRFWIILVMIMGVGFGCQLTSPRPASWSGTPTARARALTNTAIAETQSPIPDRDLIATPTDSLTETNPTKTPQPTEPPDGPWLVFPGQTGDGITAYDVDTNRSFNLALPAPVYWGDLQDGLSPDGKKLVLRAGLPTETDQLGLYQIDLPSKKVTKITPLLSLVLQRRIVNQEGTLAFDVLEAVTMPEGIAWSPDSRYLAFSAGLDNQTADLYVFDSVNQRIIRMNGLPTHSVTPFWGFESSKLISQELGKPSEDVGWRTENVTGVDVPKFDNQNTIYLPASQSNGEVFVGWLNAQTFISYSLVSDGSTGLRQVNLDDSDVALIQEGSFRAVAFDPISHTLAMILSRADGGTRGMVEGVYLLKPEDAGFQLIRGGIWDQITWDPGGMFIASGPQGLYAFSSDGENMVLPDEVWADLSPMGSWMIAWGDGARLYQPPSIYPLQTLTENQVDSVFWQPDSKGFFIQSEGSLYKLVFPGLNFQKIGDGFPEDEPLPMLWVTSDLDR